MAPNMCCPAAAPCWSAMSATSWKCGAVLDAKGDPVPEGILDAVITSLIAKHDLAGAAKGGNSRIADLYREAEDARTGRSGRRRGAVRRRRSGTRPAAADLEDGHHGRGAPDHGQPPRVHPRRQGSRSSSSTPGSWIAPAMKFTPRWRRDR